MMAESQRRGKDSHSTSFDFSWKDCKSQQAANRETLRDNTAKYKVFGESPPPESFTDRHSQNPTELCGTDQQQHLKPRDSVRSLLSPYKAMAAESRSQLQESNDFEDEYHPLPSPTRSSMRSPGKGSSARAKDGTRVTFADSSPLDPFPKTDLFTNRSGHEHPISTRIPEYGSGKSSVSIDGGFRNSYLTSTPLRKENLGSNEPAKGEPGNHGQATDHLDESSSERLLRLSSDLYVTTHLNDPHLSTSSSTWRKGFSNISKSYTLPNKPSIGNHHLYTKAENWPENSRNYKAWNPGKDCELAVHNMSIGQSGMKRSSSLNSLTTTANARADRYTADATWATNGLQERESMAGAQQDPITRVLQQLVDVVDRYWNGSGSLLQNQKFMQPARELLSELLTAHSEARAADRDSRHLESLQQQLLKVTEENCNLQGKMSRVALTESAGTKAVSLELAERYRKLDSQVTLLEQQQRNHSHHQQDTVSLLHESQRALVSTNEYLLQQLNRGSTTYHSKLLASPNGNTNKPSFLDPGPTSALPVHRTSTYRRPEQLSQCPL
ncbi:Hypothetical predicted protein [Pelobates cultripes]|uniref:Uncharacterized protein n=1 Tax=Pelobates cultripes TaxID=61616 RepID=A0AAD1WRX6_PELCU|nr:Hypothetical predicted protein [Pelobates cultripes]